MQKKILMINACGTIEGDVRMLLMGLPFLARHGFELQCVSIPRGDVYQRLCNFDFVKLITMELGGRELRTPHGLDPIARIIEMVWATIRIAILARRHKIDAIYALDRTVSMQISYFVSKIVRIPLVLSAHQPFYLEHSSKHRHIVKSATRVTVNSEFVYEQFLPHVDEEDKLVVIRNALPANRYDPTISGEKVRTELGIPPEAKVVLLAGRLDPFKGQDDLVRAAKLVLAERDDVYFLIAGREYAEGYAAKIQALIDEHKVGHRVKLIGYRTDLPQVIAASTICTMPSHSESFGIVALEGMFMAKPVIATRAGGVVEFLTHEETGFLIEPKNFGELARYILILAADEALCQRIGHKGRKQALERFSADAYGRRIIDALSEIFHQKRENGPLRPRVNLHRNQLLVPPLFWALTHHTLPEFVLNGLTIYTNMIA